MEVEVLQRPRVLEARAPLHLGKCWEQQRRLPPAPQRVPKSANDSVPDPPQDLATSPQSGLDDQCGLDGNSPPEPQTPAKQPEQRFSQGAVFVSIRGSLGPDTLQRSIAVLDEPRLSWAAGGQPVVETASNELANPHVELAIPRST
jgi:hypothetical protein